MTHSFSILQMSIVALGVSTSCGLYSVEAFSICNSSPFCCHPPSQHTKRTKLSQQSASNSPVFLHMFGNIFGGSDDKSADEELASFTNLAKSKEDVDTAYDSITTYIQDWAKLFEGEGGKQRGLTTPVTISSFVPPTPSEDDNETEVADSSVVKSSGVKLIFNPPKDNYHSGSEEGEKEKEQQEEKKEKISPGGVQVVAQKTSGGNELRVVATRCDIDEGKTIIKEMSEQTIIDDLRKAIKIWKEERK